MKIFDIFRRKKEDLQQTPTNKENFVNSSDFMRYLSSGGVGGFSSKFVSDIYKERILFPHEEMDIAQKGFKYNSYVNSAVRTRANFMTGGQIAVTSKDKGTEMWLNEMIKKTGLSKLPQFIGVDLINTGNWYAEKIRDGEGKIIYYDYISHPERIYVNIDEKGAVMDYFQETPEYAMGKGYETIQYYGDRRKTIKGKRIPKNKITHFRIGVAEIPVYGRGYVACVINDIEILLEIERAIAVISRYKAVPKKLLQLNRGDDPEGGGKAAEYYANQISNISDHENLVVPEEIKVDDLSYSGKEMNFEPIVNYLKKKITVSLAPSFIMHGEETNYAVSRDQKEAFILAVQAERETLAEQIKKELVQLSKSHNKPIKEFEIKFGDFDLGQTEFKKDYAIGAFTNNMITLDEARTILDLPKDKENGNYYLHELTAQSQLFGTMGTEASFEDDSTNDLEREVSNEVAPLVETYENEVNLIKQKMDLKLIKEKQELIAKLNKDLDNDRD